MIIGPFYTYVKYVSPVKMLRFVTFVCIYLGVLHVVGLLITDPRKTEIYPKFYTHSSQISQLRWGLHVSASTNG